MQLRFRMRPGEQGMQNLSIMKKFVILFSLICILSAALSAGNAAAYAEEPEIMVNLVQGQYAVEVEAYSDFNIVSAEGIITAYKRGKYFFSASDSEIKMNGIDFGSVLSFEPAAGKQLRINKQTYKGSARMRADGSMLYVDQAVPLEAYVAAVLGAKLSPVWPDEAIKALAVAVRSLALAKARSNGGAVRANDPDLFYGGMKLAKKAVTKTASETSGEVLYHNGNAAFAYICESSGGRTESAADALGEEISYLPSVDDYDEECPNFKWSKTLNVGVLQQVLEQRGYHVGKLESIYLDPMKEPYGAGRTATGRVKRLTVSGEKGTAVLKGEEFAEMFSLNSTLFDIRQTRSLPDKLNVEINNGMGMQIGSKEIPVNVGEQDEARWKQIKQGFLFLAGRADELLRIDGKGMGRGMGLSKWGAKNMADKAARNDRQCYQKILAHYYPGTNLIKEY